MDLEHGKKKHELDDNPHLGIDENRLLGLALVLLRLGGLATTAAAALMMGFNRQSKTLSLAIIGTASINQTQVAKFQQTPAFVFFVVINAVASGYNLLVLLLSVFIKWKKVLGLLLHVCDMVVLVVISMGAAAAFVMEDLGKNGNFHSRWFPICGKFESFCHRSEAAVAVGFVGTGFLMVHGIISNIIIYYSNSGNI